MASPAHKKQRTAEDYEEELERLKEKLERSKGELERSKGELERSNGELERSKGELERSKGELERSNGELGRSKGELERSSMLSVLPGDAAIDIPLLECVGSGKSHQYPKNEAALETQKEFVVPDLRAVDECLGLDLGRKVSCLRSCISNSPKGVLKYENEYDVHEFVHNALRDATAICNNIITKQATKSSLALPVELGVRRESPLFSSILDHVVVFDLISNAPVFSVETKQVWERLTSKVFGQVYDQLCEMRAKGHPNPFGALTCFDQTFIVWLDTFSSQQVLSDLKTHEYSSQRLGRIVSGLPGAHDASHDAANDLLMSHDQPCTQSPVKEKAATKAQFPKEGFTPTAVRQVTRSVKFGANDLVAAFASAIFCSLDGFQHPRGINSFQSNQKVEEEALCLGSNSHMWGTFRTTYLGSKKTNWLVGTPKSFYLVDLLGMGTTSKAYRALTPDGYDCVVKMYVKRRGDDKKHLSKKEFEANAKAAVTRELQAYKDIYGKELKGYVWQQCLDGMYCVVHPYFKHPDKNQRIDLLPQITERLRQCFAKRSKYFAEVDQAWRHIGWFNNKLYLFDLADLETHVQDDELIQNHVDHLRLRA